MFTSLSQPLFLLTRSGIPENIVHGAYAIKISQRECVGNWDFSFIARSLLNPWQFLATGIQGEESFLALGLAFHSGQDIHMQALAKLCEMARAGEEELICPREYPLDWEQAARLKLADQKPMRLHHPCSGKHLAMLAACERLGLPKKDYWDPHHPLQKKLFQIIGKEVGEQVQCVQDSCGLPSFYMPARAQMGMWERFALDDSSAVVGIKELWLRNPRLVGGRGRLDSDLTIAGEGRVLAKEGADGLLMLQSLPLAGETPAGCLIKLAGGYHKGHLALALLTLIRQNPELPAVFGTLGAYLQSRLDEWLPRGQKLQTL